jgi:hypothetical protein
VSVPGLDTFPEGLSITISMNVVLMAVVLVLHPTNNWLGAEPANRILAPAGQEENTLCVDENRVKLPYTLNTLVAEAITNLDVVAPKLMLLQADRLLSIVTECPAAMITLSADEGTIPPAQVLPELQFPEAREVICACIPFASNNSASKNKGIPFIDFFFIFSI